MSSTETLSDLTELTPDTVREQQKIGGLPILRADKVDTGFNFWVYGNPGVGKTLLAGSAAEVPEMCPVLFIDVEGGTLPLKERYPQVEVVRVKTFKELQAVYDELRTGRTGYRTVVLDSVSEMQKASMYGIVRQMIAEGKIEGDPTLVTPEFKQWYQNTEQMRLFIRAFRDLPMNTIFTSLASHEKDEKTKLWVTKPGLSNKLSFEAAGFVDIVAYMYVKLRRTKETGEERVRLLLTATTDTVTAKDRSGRLPLLMEYPTMNDIHRHLHGNGDN